MSKTRTAVAAALTLLVAYPALAAGKSAEAKAPSAETCKSLEAQFGSAAKTHAKAPKFKEAEAARAEGKRLCDEGKYSEGTTKLHMALKDLGMKVTTKSY